MSLRSINPATEEILNDTRAWNDAELDHAVQQSAEAASSWAATPIEERCERLGALANLLRKRRGKLALLITREMGKLITESHAEIDKCARVCEYYAEHAPELLGDED